MGADMFLERTAWRPRPIRARKTRQNNISIFEDTFFYGYKKRGVVKDTPDVRKVLQLIRAEIIDD